MTVGSNNQFSAGSFDSLSAVEFSTRLAEIFDLQLPGTLVFDYPSVEAIAQYICEALDHSSCPNAVHQTAATLVRPLTIGVDGRDVEVGLQKLV